MTSIADALLPAVRQRVLVVLFGAPGRRLYAHELIALGHSDTGAVQRELASLLAAGLVTLRRRAQDNAFVTRVLDQPRICLPGDEEALHGDRSAAQPERAGHATEGRAA